MLSEATYNRIYRASAWYDLVITWPYATPLTFGIMWQMLGNLHDGLGLAALPVLTVYGILFGNFLGSVVIVWSIVRLWLDDARLGRFDAAARWLFSAWMIVALMNGASPILWVFLMVEISWGVAQSLPIRKSE